MRFIFRKRSKSDEIILKIVFIRTYLAMKSINARNFFQTHIFTQNVITA